MPSPTTHTQTLLSNPSSQSNPTMSTQPLDVVDFVVNQGHGIRGLSATGLTQVPSNYLQPPEEQFDASKVVTDESIPVIDVSDMDDDLTRSSMCDAAALYGFFQVVNHGIPLEVMEKLQSAAHRFFEMPTSEKVKYKTEEVVGAKVGTSFSPANEKVMEWKDFLSLRFSTDEETASQTWPSICRDETLDYYKRLKVVIKKIYDVLLKGLNVETGFDESKESLLMGWIALNFNYYPSCPNPNLTVGVGRHSDASGITVLLQDDVGGLYVRAPTESESWVHVAPRSGALVINVGDMLQIVSNGRYKSVEHKAVASTGRNRLSVAVFVNPAMDQVVAPLEEVVESTGEAPMYRGVVFSDYFKYYYSKGHDGKASVEWAKI